MEKNKKPKTKTRNTLEFSYNLHKKARLFISIGHVNVKTKSVTKFFGDSGTLEIWNLESWRKNVIAFLNSSIYIHLRIIITVISSAAVLRMLLRTIFEDHLLHVVLVPCETFFCILFLTDTRIKDRSKLPSVERRIDSIQPFWFWNWLSIKNTSKIFVTGWYLAISNT